MDRRSGGTKSRRKGGRAFDVSDKVVTPLLLQKCFVRQSDDATRDSTPWFLRLWRLIPGYAVAGPSQLK